MFRRGVEIHTTRTTQLLNVRTCALAILADLPGGTGLSTASTMFWIAADVDTTTIADHRGFGGALACTGSLVADFCALAAIVARTTMETIDCECHTAVGTHHFSFWAGADRICAALA